MNLFARCLKWSSRISDSAELSAACPAQRVFCRPPQRVVVNQGNPHHTFSGINTESWSSSVGIKMPMLGTNAAACRAAATSPADFAPGVKGYSCRAIAVPAVGLAQQSGLWRMGQIIKQRGSQLPRGRHHCMHSCSWLSATPTRCRRDGGTAHQSNPAHPGRRPPRHAVALRD